MKKRGKKGVPHKPPKGRQHTPGWHHQEKNHARGRVDADTARELLDALSPTEDDGEDTAVVVDIACAVKDRDPRDPYGNFRSQMIQQRIGYVWYRDGRHTLNGEPVPKNFNAHDAVRLYRKEHPEFEEEYQRELTRREVEASSGPAGSPAPHPDGGTPLRADETRDKAPAHRGEASHPQEEPVPCAPAPPDPARRAIASAVRQAAGPRRRLIGQHYID